MLWFAILGALVTVPAFAQEAPMAQPHAYTNRLAHEASPYLLQHAHNPVDWWPWGEEAFAEARRRDVPIFLSIGYSTCYWCHVMERESFENERIAALMNKRFVCVKVDREQRPDVDDLYMAATQIMTGHGGWPMSVFLEPEGLRPFWCGTYFPAEERPGLGSMPTFPRVLEGISGAWVAQRAEVMAQAESVAASVREHLAGGAEPAGLSVATVRTGVSALLRMFDRQQGGFGGAPKFPQPVYLDLLLDVRDRAGDDATGSALDEAIRHTLDRMAVGGLRDQVGGGFHRYSVDATWTVPHFEKMLYDNAMLAEVYARAGARYDDWFYREVSRSTIAYVLREMTLRDGSGAPLSFFTAQDAEVDRREGLNYLWTAEQIRAALGPEDAELALGVYGVVRGANFRDPHHPDEPSSSVLRMADRPGVVARGLGMDAVEFGTRMAGINEVLLGVRAGRKQPHLDDKAVLSWNALMVRTLAVSAMVDPGPERDANLGAAVSVARSLVGTMAAEDGTLLRIGRAGRVQTPAMLEDYAAMVRALVTLAAVAGETADGAWAEGEARRLIGQAEVLFGDGRGGFYDTRAGAADLFVRSRATYDGAMPAGSTLMALALAELAVRTRGAEDVDRAVGAIRSISGAIAENPVGTAVGTRALLTMLREPGLAAGRLGFDASGEPIGGEGAVRAEPAGLAAADFTPVEVFAADERLVLKPGEPGELRLMIRVAPGFHVVAADPGEEASGLGLVPFRVDVVDAEAGGGVRHASIVAYADYPAGSSFKPSEQAAAMLVYEGEFELVVALERGAGAARQGRPILVVTFQACTETECLRAQRVELDVAIDPG